MNTYRYVNNNPVLFTDPTGKICASPWGAVLCGAAATYLIITNVKQCSTAVNNVDSGIKNAHQRGSEQDKAIDCAADPSCRGATAQEHEDKSRESGKQTVRDAGNATYGLGTSVPGTTASGPVPTSIDDYLVGGGFGEMIY